MYGLAHRSDKVEWVLAIRGRVCLRFDDGLSIVMEAMLGGGLLVFWYESENGYGYCARCEVYFFAAWLQNILSWSDGWVEECRMATLVFAIA